MKPFFLIFIFNSLLILTSYSQEKQESTTTEQETVALGWPKDIDRLIEHLNSWDTDELNTFERPELDPNRKTSGETNGWIAEHKSLLQELGAAVIWNKELLKYELVKG
jgi:hypothetical protein